GANEEMIENGFRILLSDRDVKAVFVNIFGGILRCDILAEGIVKAAKKMTDRLPVVIRLEGTNVEEGRRILKDSGLEFATAKNLVEAGQMVAQAVGKEDS
ncbi:MAG: succinate--CoA ligase subunit beta, partial [Candidatus Bipolaricaulota bacterium]|nr:succinate--CoA ligase subunit beta [Candidatus Bipolaricaulota bacterium]